MLPGECRFGVTLRIAATAAVNMLLVLATPLTFSETLAHVGRINICAIQLLRAKFEHTCVRDSGDTVQLVLGRSS